MTKFWQVNEDPMYDDDGVLVDEDADWQDVDNEQGERVFKAIVEELSPHNTVNS
jgi:hypothetical protein